VHGHGIDWLATGTFSRLLVPRETVNASGVTGVKADEAGADPIAVLFDVEAGDDVTAKIGVPRKSVT